MDQVEPLLMTSNDTISGRFGDLRIGSAFQPIYSLAHRRHVGFEALLRATSAYGDKLSPFAAFELAQGESECVLLDRLSRLVHIRNFFPRADDNSWLFLNINPLVTVYGRRYGGFFTELLERYAIPPHRIVIEILEGQIQDEGLLVEAVEYYRQLGCLIAIDDFGAGHSNFDRVWRIAPHIVKLDRNIVSQAVNNRNLRRVVPTLVNLVHEGGSLALMEGVETEAEALIALDSDTDFVQGYYFARPEFALPSPDEGRNRIDELCLKFGRLNKEKVTAQRKKLHTYLDAFQVFIKQFKAGNTLASACRGFLGLPRVERCYILDKEGRQLGDNLRPFSAASQPDARFLPLIESNDSVWARRQYFREAIAKPGELQVSRPYLSIAGGNLCVTISMAVFSGKEIVVLCGDIKWNE